MTDKTLEIQEWHGAAFPAIFGDTQSGQSLAETMAAHKAAVTEQVEQVGAVLFRGYDVQSVEDFDKAVTAFEAPNFPYKESLSNAVRVNLTERVFTANEAPPHISIFLHHEMAQTPIYPSKLFFYCEIAAEDGGATPLCRSDILLEQLAEKAPDFVQALEARGVKYKTVMPPNDDAQSGLGRSWRSTLTAETRDQAQARLRQLGYSWEWQEDDVLVVTTPRLDAVKTLADGRRVFFNQLIAAFRGWKDERNDPSKSITFGDSSRIDPDDMAIAIQLSDELSFDMNWQKGDVVLVDNFIVMHGRRPFEGKRRVLASLVA
ncbi:TauD/TfdA family dioxygenase [Parvularcula sp. IMCC14364]|uniref:TauD/TfdA family dioxygenase n=1 Tax=Parvularcula sp. IMCC14364 TaxID=3067902 RepID=UPI0027414397|nr:TauD/TfdA family dioxygenase [Parvularcula sp. IMCC14364]